MKIKFLGTSHGVPEPDRFCCCTAIEVNDAIYVIDAGGPMLDLLLRAGIDPEKVKGIFLTHTHSDHIAGLYGFLAKANRHYTNASVDVFMPDRRECEILTDLIEYVGDRPLDPSHIRWHILHEGPVFADENIRITAAKNDHLKKVGRPSYSFLVEAEGKKIVFAGDLSQNLAAGDYPRAALEQETDVVICEFAHFTPAQVEDYMKNTRTKQFWYHHVGVSKKFDRFEAIKEMGKNVPYPVMTAWDGDEITL